MNPAALDVAKPRYFSPWVAVECECRTCKHSIGTDGPHLFCQRARADVIKPCGYWEREPGTEA